MVKQPVAFLTLYGILTRHGEDWARWDEYLVLAMGRCTKEFEKLPLVQDKALLDNILYSGVWCSFRGKKKEQEESQ